jgi:2-polyprenyl-3-methyl-5-hydroxy-6-metoxy-1,4-benzoquinol methylase
LPSHYVPGFLRYEIDAHGNINLPEIHASFHWCPDSVERFGEYIFANFTNPNMGSYILTQSHLSIAIQSNNYCLLPKRSRYGIIESSVCDVFYDCNLKLMTCISHIDQFLIHHMSNRFLGHFGITKEQLKREIEALLDIEAGKLPDYRLFETETKLAQNIFDKSYYSKCNFHIVKAVGWNKQKNVLSVGCGSAETEAEILKYGHQVTAIPLDMVISVTAQAKGIKTLTSNFNIAFNDLAEQKFDCIIFDNVLQHLPEPIKILTRFSSLLSQEGTIIANFLNTDCSHWLNKRYLSSVRNSPFSPMDESIKDRSFQGLGVHLTNGKNVKPWFDESGLKLYSMTYLTPRSFRKKVWLSMGLLTARLSPNFMIIAKKR